MISIIIPVYNRAKVIGKTLESIKNQTYKNYEVIIINDGSTDKTEDAVSNFLAKAGDSFTNELSFFNQKNQGAPAARNNGFQKAKGDLLFFCDADTFLKPEALEKMFNTLAAHPEASYTYSSFFWGKKLFKLFPFDANRLRQMPYINTMSLIRRSDFPVQGWDVALKKFQDWDLWLTMLEQGHIGFWIEEPLFTIDPSGIISNWLPKVAYKYFPFLPAVQRYNNAMAIIKKKHSL
jgi:glycosyltransferase involved in cell wall biosynthesis